MMAIDKLMKKRGTYVRFIRKNQPILLLLLIFGVGNCGSIFLIYYKTPKVSTFLLNGLISFFILDTIITGFLYYLQDFIHFY